MKILRITNQDKKFYSILGPYLAKRDIEREVGYKLYDDNGKVWIVATEMNEVAGFCYIWEKTKGKFQIGSFYVPDDYRRKGMFKRLLEKTIQGITGSINIVTKNQYVCNVLIEKGFKEIRKRGSFIEYNKEIVNDEKPSV